MSKARSPLLKQLEREPHRFGFFQAMRLLEAEAALAGEGGPRPVGRDHRPWLE